MLGVEQRLCLLDAYLKLARTMVLRSICVAAEIRVRPRIRGLPDVDGSLAPHTRPQILNAAVLGSIGETTY